jgi:hypothetical protein
LIDERKVFLSGFFGRFRVVGSMVSGFCCCERRCNFLDLVFELFESSSKEACLLILWGFGVNAGFLVAALDTVFAGGMLTVALL